MVRNAVVCQYYGSVYVGLVLLIFQLAWVVCWALFFIGSYEAPETTCDGDDSSSYSYDSYDSYSSSYNSYSSNYNYNRYNSGSNEDRPETASYYAANNCTTTGNNSPFTTLPL